MRDEVCSFFRSSVVNSVTKSLLHIVVNKEEGLKGPRLLKEMKTVFGQVPPFKFHSSFSSMRRDFFLLFAVLRPATVVLQDPEH